MSSMMAVASLSSWVNDRQAGLPPCLHLSQMPAESARFVGFRDVEARDQISSSRSISAMPGRIATDKGTQPDHAERAHPGPLSIGLQDQVSLAAAIAALFCLAAVSTFLFIGPRGSADDFAPETTSRVRLQVDLNRANCGELSVLPGIGPEMSQRIVNYRVQNGLFATIDGLRQVGGIGPIRLEQLRPYLFVREEESVDVATAPARDVLPR